MSHDTLHLPLVSIIVPAFNRADLLPRAIETVARQHYPSYELLIIDDHSTDNTAELVARCAAADRRIRYIRNRGLQGTSFTRNLGINKSDGEYIAFLDSDDLWLPDHLARAVDILEAAPDIALYFGNRVRFDLRTDTDLEPPFPSQWLLRRVSRVPIEEHTYRLGTDLLELLIVSNPLAVSGAVVRRTSLGPIRFDTHLKVSEDRDMWLRICLSSTCSVAFRDRTVTRIARHNGNISGGSPSEQIRLIQSHQYIFRKLLADSRLTARQRRLVHRQSRMERGLLPFWYRQIPRPDKAFKATFDNLFHVWPWQTLVELLKSSATWIRLRRISRLHRLDRAEEVDRKERHLHTH